ncbi:MAG: extracellular solute-binding protein [Proteobacteria bacterium]|nr:extracellular solute-binding protein [Pseudomonadota bacterium]MBI3499651.1 extracellular solute-binding protein [Pseudomonadota bacterium]
MQKKPCGWILCRALALVGFGAVLAGLNVAHAEEKLVLMTWGGSWLGHIKKNIIEPFQQETGIKVELRLQATSLEALPIFRAERDKPTIDVWTASPVSAIFAAKENLLTPIPKEAIKNAAHIPPELVHPEWIGWYRLFWGLCYDKQRAPFELKEWKDLWDPRLKGGVALPSAVYSQAKFITLAAWLAGSDERNVDPAFALLKQLKPNAGGYYTGDPEGWRYMEAGELPVMGFCLAGAYIPRSKANPNFRFVAPKPTLASVDTFSLMKGPNQANGLKFIDFALGKKAEEAFSQDAVVMPANRTAEAPPSIKQVAPPEDNFRYVDEAHVSTVINTWVERWNREIQGP